MPSHWGTPALQHRRRARAPTGTQCCRRSARPKPACIYEPRRRRSRIATRASTPTRSSYVSLGDGATSEGEFWESLNTACTQAAAGAVPRRRQRLRDLGAGRSADARRRHLAPRRARSPACTSTRSTAPTSSPAYRAMREAVAYVRARKGPALVHAHVIRPVLALALRRREAVQDAGGARGRSARAIRSRGSREFLRANGARDRRRTSRRSPPRSSARSTRRPTAALAAPKPAQDTAALWVYSPDVDPDVGRVRHAGAARGQARHDGRAPSTAR